MKYKITLITLFSAFSLLAQVTNEGKPLSWKLNGTEKPVAIAMPAFDLKTLQAEDAINDIGKNKPWRFGKEFLVDYNLANAGSWTDLPNGDRIWRIRFTSAGAKTMNFLFSDFYMPQGANVYLYNNAHTDLLGAYDDKQNNPEHVLGTWLVKGQDIWIEYYEPKAVAGQGKLEIFKVVHGYRTQDEGFTKSPDDGLNTSGACNYDVDCYMDDIDGLKDINKKAVALIITDNSGFCTGSLVNNTANDGTPYFLTANHCYSNPSQWAFRFNWISPNPVCAGTENSTSNTPNFYQTTSGATLKARKADSDFCLLQITANIPSAWDLVYAGWDRTPEAPESVFGIHHPAGDIMKACRDFGPLATEDYFWRIEDWDLGVTEGGSSGSPLYDNNGRLRGQLYGGNSACDGTSDNGEFDAYGRFDKSWDNGTTAATRLSDWLDPANTGALTLDYYPPAQLYAVDAKVTITDLRLEVCEGYFAPQIRLTNKGTNNLTIAEIRYTVNGNTPGNVIYWNGNLATGQSEIVNLTSVGTEVGNNDFTVTIVNPNGVADEHTADNTASQAFVALEYEVTNVNFALTTDGYGNETSWELTDGTGTVLYNGEGYTGFETVTETFNLTNEGCYTFTIYDEENDGICCSYGNGSYRLTTANGTEIASGGSFGSSDAVTFTLKSGLGTAGHELQNAISVYPNPSSGIFKISNTSGMAPAYSIYNTLGQEVGHGSINGTNATINLSGNATGIYLLKLADTNGKTAVFKLLKQ